MKVSRKRKIRFEKATPANYSITGLFVARDIVIELTEEQIEKLKQDLMGDDYYINVRMSYE